MPPMMAPAIGSTWRAISALLLEPKDVGDSLDHCVGQTVLDHLPVMAVGVDDAQAAEPVIGGDANVVRLDAVAHDEHVPDAQVSSPHRRHEPRRPYRSEEDRSEL